MGLDMYLRATRYFGYFDFPQIPASEDQAIIKNLVGFLPELGEVNGITIKFEMGYWRKFQDLHDWFVENIQDGNDNCEEYFVSNEALELLLVEIRKILDYHNNKNETNEELRGEPEVIMGTTNYIDYDEYDLEIVERTEKTIIRCLALPPNYSIEYLSSW